MTSARRLVEPTSRPFSAVEMIITAPLGVGAHCRPPKTWLDRGDARDSLKQKPVKVDSTDRDRVIEPVTQIRHPGAHSSLLAGHV